MKRLTTISALLSKIPIIKNEEPIKFDDVKKLVTTLFKEMAVAKGILKGEEKK